MKASFRFLLCLAFAAAFSLTAFGQASPTGSIGGTVTDATGAVVPGCEVLAKNDETGQEFRILTADNGTYSIPNVPRGLYSVTATVAGFKQGVVRNVQVVAATPATVNVRLEVGAQAEQVVVLGGAEILQTQSANVATTVMGRQITELPFASRDALDLVLLLPGTATTGRPRSSSVNGLPKGSLNITMDGVNVQDNLLKSSDGFFTYIRPRIDAMEEVTVSSATPGAESSSEGAVQIKFVTRAGTNDYHGGIYEYHRNPALNANYWYNNRDSAKNCNGGTAACRDRVLLNQYGFKVGGPIGIPGLFSGRDRAFFFVNYEEYRLPEQVTRQRTVLTETARQGQYKYVTSTGTQTVDLYALAARFGHTSTPDPIIGSLLSDIRKSTASGALTALSDPNLERFTFTNPGGQNRYFPTIRFDFNITPKHHLENVWNYQAFRNTADFLNGVDPAFPGFPNTGGQNSNRWSNVTAWRATILPTLINEARFGMQGGVTLFFAEVNTGQFANQGGYNLGIGAAGITSATVTTGPQRRNSPVKQFNDTLTWIKGTHNLNFGYNFTQINLWNNTGAIVPGISLGVATQDPADSMFVQANFPGSSAADVTRARGIWATLVGRVTNISATAYLGEDSKYYYLGRYVQRAYQREMGMFASDSWRWKPNFTLNYGVRWEVQFPFQTTNNTYSATTYDGLWGVSGLGNLFKPGTLAGKETTFTSFGPGSKAYDTQWKNFAPSLGFAWSPNFKNPLVKAIFGEGAGSVIRAGYSIAYVREGTNVVSSLLGSNPGGSIDASRNTGLGNLTLPVLFRDKASLAPPTIQSAPSYPMTGTISQSANAFDPKLRLGYVQSWSIGLQRELSRDTVLEFRYTGNHGTKLWRQYNLNEINLIENGMYTEFRTAMQNLQANIAAGRGQTFAYRGAGTGTSPLPITLAYFSGVPAAQAGDATRYTSSNFTSTTWVNQLFPLNPSASGYASNLYSDATRRTNAATAGLPANLFLLNPGKLGGSYVVDNGGASYYNAFTIELRRRMAKGLLVQGSYTFSKAMANAYASSSVVYSDYFTLRNTKLNRTIQPFDIPHNFKVNWIWELPVGRGKNFFSGANSIVNQVIGNWEFHGTARMSSGPPVSFGNIDLVGMNRQDLADAIQIRQDDARKITYYFPQDIIDNTIKAWNLSSTGYTLGAPSGRYIRPAQGPNCVASFGGACGYSYVIGYGPEFTRFDLSAVKRFKITERIDFEFRAEFLNAFNNINFRIVGEATEAGSLGGFSSTTFAQSSLAYRDLSTTNDPGGRMIQFVGRINF